MSPRKVDPYVYVMEWIFQHSKAEGLTRAVLLSIGRWMRWTPSGFETGPLPTRQIADGAKVGDSTVREHLGTLAAEGGDVEIIKGRRRGETYRYRLRREQMLPLADIRPNLHSRMAAVSPLHYSDDTPPDYSCDTAIMQRSDRHDPAVSAPACGGDVRDVPFSSDLVRTEEVPPTTDEQAAADFFEWFLVTYLSKRGFPYRVKRDVALSVIRELLRDRQADRLRAMAVLMFDAVNDEFITRDGNDRSLFVLRHKATYLEGIAVKNEQREAVG